MWDVDKAEFRGHFTILLPILLKERSFESIISASTFKKMKTKNLIGQEKIEKTQIISIMNDKIDITTDKRYLKNIMNSFMPIIRQLRWQPPLEIWYEKLIPKEKDNLNSSILD